MSRTFALFACALAGELALDTTQPPGDVMPHTDMRSAGNSPGQGNGIPPRRTVQAWPPLRAKTPRLPPSCMLTCASNGAEDVRPNVATAQYVSVAASRP